MVEGLRPYFPHATGFLLCDPSVALFRTLRSYFHVALRVLACVFFAAGEALFRSCGTKMLGHSRSDLAQCLRAGGFAKGSTASGVQRLPRRLGPRAPVSVLVPSIQLPLPPRCVARSEVFVSSVCTLQVRSLRVPAHPKCS